jgi:PAS domain S-box-containing protein
LALAFATSTALLRRRNTQFIRRELLLGESRERLNAIIRSVPDAIVIYASNGTIIDWNDGAVECFGFNKDKVLGRSLIDLIIPQQGRSDNSLITDMLFQAGNFNIGGKRLELNVSNAEGEIFPVEITIGVSRGHGDPTFVAYIRNISDRAEAERLLKADLLKAEAANSSKARFLAVMSHEMRTPLNGVIGTLDLLAGSPLDDEQRKLVDVALTSGEELLSQISDVLDFSKMEAGKLELEIQAFDIGKCVASVVDMLAAYRAENANIISARIDPGLSGPRMGDVGRIRQILVNLGSNGMKFTQAGDVEVSVSRVNDSRVRFEVRDNGQGVSRDDLPKLFHEFTMFDTSLRRASGGTGLGLAICKRLVLAMGGQIGVESELGVGSVFWFELDLERPLQTVDGNVPVVQLGQPAKGLKVLLVEDNKTNQFVTTQMLSKFRCDVVMVENGFEALKKIATIAFDLVLMDISMPVMDGIEAIARLRSQDGPEASMRVVALTANALTGDKERFKELGFSDYISKPVRQIDLQRILLAAHRGVQELQSVDHRNDLFNTAQIDSMVLGELMESLGPGAFEQVFASFKSDIVRNLMRMQIAAFAKDEKEMKKAAHAISGASATLGLNKLCGHASEMEQSRTILRAVDVVEKIRQLEDCFKAACCALEKFSDGSHFGSNTGCINISKRQYW